MLVIPENFLFLLVIWLSTLSNWLKPVCGQLGKSNINFAHDFCPDLLERNQMYQIFLSNLYTLLSPINFGFRRQLAEMKIIVNYDDWLNAHSCLHTLFNKSFC